MKWSKNNGYMEAIYKERKGERYFSIDNIYIFLLMKAG